MIKIKQLIQPIYQECVYYKNKKDNKIIILEKYKVYGKLIYTELSETKRETINNIDEIPHCTYQGFIKKNRGRKYFNRYCSNGCLNKRHEPQKIKSKDVLGMNMKLFGRNIEKFKCKKCLMKELGWTKEDWNSQVEDFKMQGCKLF